MTQEILPPEIDDVEDDVHHECNLRELRFCEEFIVHGHGTKSAIAAGYSETSAHVQASRLLKKDKIKRKIGELRGDAAAALGIDAQYVLQVINNTIRRCSQAEPVYDRFGKQVVIETDSGDEAAAYTFDSKGVLKGAELLGKHLKLFTDVKELRGPGGGPIAVEAITNEQDALRMYQEATKGIRPLIEQAKAEEGQ